MHWSWPQWVVALFILSESLSVCYLHGKPRPPYNAGLYLLINIIFVWILWAGGFWN